MLFYSDSIGVQFARLIRALVVGVRSDVRGFGAGGQRGAGLAGGRGRGVARAERGAGVRGVLPRGVAGAGAAGAAAVRDGAGGAARPAPRARAGRAAPPLLHATQALLQAQGRRPLLILTPPSTTRVSNFTATLLYRGRVGPPRVLSFSQIICKYISNSLNIFTKFLFIFFIYKSNLSIVIYVDVCVWGTSQRVLFVQNVCVPRRKSPLYAFL